LVVPCWLQLKIQIQLSYLDINRSTITLSKHIDENELVKRIRNREPSALEYLYDRYSGALYGMVLRILKDEAIAEEVLQDIFLKIWERFDHYDGSKGKLFTWMINIARNQAIDKTRSREISQKQKTGGLEKVVHDETRNFVESGVDAIGVKEALNSLPEEQKFVVEKLYLGGYTQSEMAEEFNIPLGTVKTRLRLAMQQLRLILGIS
jgi:RNA polymerase sigma factor (sigma-70 family)